MAQRFDQLCDVESRHRHQRGRGDQSDRLSAHDGYEERLEGVPKLFHLRCSPRAASESSAAAEAFVTRFREARPSWDIDVMDIWRETLPEFGTDALEAKYARLSGRAFSDAQRSAFAV